MSSTAAPRTLPIALLAGLLLVASACAHLPTTGHAPAAAAPMAAGPPPVAPDAVPGACPATVFSSQPYFQNGQFDLLALIPPPPVAGSEAAARDLEGVLDAQRLARQQGTTERAVGDAEVNCLRFADVLGPRFSVAQAPRAVYFLNRAALAGASASGPGKTYWWRPRPYAVSAKVEPLADVAPGALERPGPFDAFRASCNPGQPARAPRSTAEVDPERWRTSYPSGHSAFGMSCAILLAEMVPEQREALFRRGRQYGESRLIVGAHFPSDIESGRVLATVAAAAMQQNAAFRHDFEVARTELRAALGLPAEPPELRPGKPERPPATP